jgi:hypothetical protein
MTGPAEDRHYLNPGGNPDVRKLLDELLRRTGNNVRLLLDGAARACLVANPTAPREDALRRTLEMLQGVDGMTP